MPFLQNIWYAAAWGRELADGVPLARTVAGHAMVLFRQRDGTAVALEDRCSHRCAPLSSGRVQGDALRCWYHGLLFDGAGECLEMPGQEKVAPGFNVRSYPLCEQEGCIWVWTGALELADRALIPESGLDAGGLEYCVGTLDYAGDYELINDNLCDFSHVAYVHEQTLGQGNEEWSQRLPTLTNLPSGIRSTRWIESAALFPVPGLPMQRFDQWTAYDYLIPGVLVMQIEFYDPGKAKAFAFAAPSSLKDALFVLRTLQTATPVRPGIAQYMYSVSLPVSPAPEALAATHGMFEYAFLEDKQMIEAQQANINANPGVALRNTLHDAGLMRIRRLIASRLRDEARHGEPIAVGFSDSQNHAVGF